MSPNRPSRAARQLTIATVAVAIGLCAAALGAGAFSAPRIGVLQAELTPDDAGPGARFGNAVALSLDTAVVGTNGPNDGPTNIAEIFVRHEGVWTEQARLVPEPGTAYFSAVVAVDRDTAIVGSYLSGNQGSVTVADVFVRSQGAWALQARLAPENPDGGTASALSDLALEGDTAVGVTYDGGAYVFRRQAGSWSQEAKLVPTGDTVSYAIPARAAISGDTVALGMNAGGAVHVFVRRAGTWSEEASLVASGATALSGAVSLSGDTLLAAAQAGPCVFVRRSGTWTQELRLVPYQYGYSASAGVIVGDTAVVPEMVTRTGDAGAYFSNVIAIYQRTGDAWTKDSEVAIDDPAVEGSVGPISLSGDTMLLGSGTAGLNERGAAYALVLQPAPSDSGCACRAGAPTAPAPPIGAAMTLVAALAGRRRRARSRETTPRPSGGRA